MATQELLLLKMKKARLDAADNSMIVTEINRVHDVVKNWEVSHPPDTFLCPVCLECDPMWPSEHASSPLGCCGKYIHPSCMQEAMTHGHFICPLCNGKIFESDEDVIKQEEMAAKKGYPFAVLNRAKKLYDGSFGFLVNRPEAKTCVKRLAYDSIQPHAPAMLELGKIYREEGDFANAKKEYTRAAERGSGYGHAALARILWGLHGGLVHLTLAYSMLKKYNKDLIMLMAAYYDNPKQGNNSVLSCMYYREALEEGVEEAKLLLAKTIVVRSQIRYRDFMFSNTVSSMSKAFYYAKKLQIGTNEANQFVEDWTRKGREYCNYCHKRCLDGFQRCSRCKAAWYCGRECQRNAWKYGHREVCLEVETNLDD